jgi:RNA polymerase primary sigma factor
MSKKPQKKPFFPPRRAVKRGAPPIIKPRRGPARVQGMARPDRLERHGERNETLEKRGVTAALADPSKKPVAAHEGEGHDEVEVVEGAEAGVSGLGGDVLEFEARADTDDEEAAHIEDEELEVRDADAPEVEEEKKAPKTDEAGNFLAMYFREMADLEVLRPEDEFRQARELEQLEIQLWERIFAYAPALEHVLRTIEITMENSLPEFRSMRKLLAERTTRTATTTTTAKRPSSEPNVSRATAEKLGKASRKAAEKLRAMDIDRRLVAVVLGELAKVESLAPGCIVEERLIFNPRGAAFGSFYREVVSGLGRVQRAKNEFVKANLRLVVSIARRFNHGRMPLADLIQEGNIGLIKAVERFDHARGYRFSTYASWWIRHAISRALADKGRAVRLPVHMIDAYHRVAKARRELTAKLGRNPTSDELGEATQIPAAKIEKMRTYLLDQSFSLDKPVSDEDGRRFIDFIQDPSADEPSPIDDLADRAVTDEMRHLLAGLKPIEAEILRQRFGLDDDKELTLKEIGEKYNLSRERIRQLQEQALTKMRRALQRKDLM